MKDIGIRSFLNKKIIGVGILIWLLSKIDLTTVTLILFKTDIYLVIGAVALMATHVLVKFLRYKLILVFQGVQISFHKTIHYCFASIYLSFITPGRVGELSKSYFIHKSTGVDLSKLLAGSIADRLLDVYILLFTATVGLGSMRLLGPYSIPLSGIILLLASSPLLLLFIKVRGGLITVLKNISPKSWRSHKWFASIEKLFHEIRSLCNYKLLYCFLITIGAYLLFYGSCFMMAKSIGIPLPYHKVAIFIACANILSFLPISFSGIGTREACLVYLFSVENLTSESALAFSMLIFTFTYLLFGLVGFISFITLDYSHQEVIDNA